MRTTAALFTILSTLAILSVPFAQARNDHNDHSFGQISRTSISVIVERNLKVGNFTVSFSDLNIPVAGVPMEVIRTYDSRDKRVGDFGFGWTLGLRNIRVEKSGVLGFKSFETVSQEVFPNYCRLARGHGNFPGRQGLQVPGCGDAPLPTLCPSHRRDIVIHTNARNARDFGNSRISRLPGFSTIVCCFFWPYIGHLGKSGLEELSL